MKYLLILICTLTLLFQTLNAQDKCSKFYPITENASFTSSVYNTRTDAENNVNKAGDVTFSVDEVLDNGALYTVTVSMNLITQQAQYKITCTDDGVTMDPTAMAGGMLSRFSDAEITGDNIFLPNNLSPPFPLDLDDASITINASNAGIAMTMTRSRTKRRITGQEDIITPARTDAFQCYVLEYEVGMTVNGNTVMSSKKKEWLSEDFGVVQSQEFDANGNETSFSWLVEYTQ